MDVKSNATEYLTLLMEVPEILECPHPECPRCMRNKLWAEVAQEMLLEGTYPESMKDVVITHYRKVKQRLSER
jgi:hypothetical protein